MPVCIMSVALGLTTNAADRQVLRDHLPPAVKNLRSAERMPGTNELDLVIGLPLRNRDALVNLLKELYDPTSTNYHRYLTPGQFASQFGPTREDYQKVIAFTEAHGMRVVGTHPNRTLLDVRAPVSAIEKTLHLTMNVYQHPKEARTFYAPDAEPSLDLGVQVLSIGGLDDFSPPRPMNLRVVPLGDSSGPSANPLIAGSGPRGFLVGQDFRSAYAQGLPLDGTGQSVGLFELGGYYPSDITSYETVAGIPRVPLVNVFLNGVTGKPSDSNIEVALDICMAISMAPGLSNVMVYQGRTPNDILNRMATDNISKSLSSSWTWSGFGGQDTTEQILQQFAAQGQSFFQASGDDGAYCGQIFTPSDDPYATSVGGTIVTTRQPDGALLSETTCPFSSGGITTNYSIPSYQKGVDMSANGGSTTLRNIPDVACVAQDIWVIANNGEQFSGSGTSASAPLWAGFAALANQQAVAQGKPTVGFINPAIYAIASSPQYTSALHDITTGNNTNGCGVTKFLAVPGYDLCTGWGTPNGSNTIDALLAPADALQISPLDGIVFSGPQGGPFNPPVDHFFLTNVGTTSLNWMLVNTSAWLNASPSGGTLVSNKAYGFTSLTVNPVAETFPVGSYFTTIRFTNLNDSFGQSRRVTLAVIAPPIIISPPQDQPVFEGATAAFAVGTSTNALLSYQWFFDNGSVVTRLVDGGNLSGSSTATLTISNASFSSEGAYSVIVSNAAGAATSSLAFLTIVPWRPVIIQQPASQTNLSGQSISLNTTVVGSKPLTFQWRKNGTNIADGGNLSGALTANLTFSNLTTDNSGTYTLVITNALGSATSVDAVLTVISPTTPTATLATLYSFSGNLDGAHPNGLLQAANGLFYGTSQRGGASFSGNVFQFAPGSAPVNLYSFSGSNDGANPFSTLVQGFDGSFYGTAYQGGAADNGTIFRLSANGVFTTLVSLDISVGDLPYAGLVFGPDSSLYGTAYQGGAGGRGTAFRVTANGALTVLYAFTNGLDGGHIAARLALGSDGNFYGTTFKGGSAGNGVVYRVSTNGLMTTLAAFSPATGAFPYAGLAEGPDGKFYGVTSQGGFAGVGNIFSVTRSGQLANLYSFTNGPDGNFPVAGLLLAADGNFYGTTAYGGAYGAGTVFRFTLDGTFTPLAQFNGYNGANPQAVLAQGADGSLYGTTQNGGTDNQGVIFRLTSTGAPQISGQPLSQFVFAGDTVHFGVAVVGAPPLSYQWLKNGTNLPDGGAVFGAMTRTPVFTNIAVADGGSYSVIISNSLGSVTSSIASLSVTSSPPYFTLQPTNQSVAPGANVTFAATALGNVPLSYQWLMNGVPLPNGGKISGVTTPTLSVQAATEANNGSYTVIASNALDSISSTAAVLTVIPVSAPGTRLTTLYSFTGGVNGRTPNGLAVATNGDLYGTTQLGGSHLAGSVFKITTNGVLTFLASLGGTNGTRSHAPVTLGIDGNWYGTTESDGEIGYGTVFRMTPAGALSPAHAFDYFDDGAAPFSGLIVGTDGRFYGNTSQGGTSGYGNIFRLATNGTFDILYSFTNGVDGASPSGALLQAADGNFYGMTPSGANGFGNIFRMTPAGALANVYSFKGGSDGSAPAGALVQGTDGNFYGTTTHNSISGFQFYGTIFRLTPAGALSTLYMFNGIINSDGHYPHAGLLLASDGCFYGTTFQGGTGNNGTIFRIGPDGTFSTIFSFDGFNDGANPEAALVQGTDGSLYGTATTGGFGGQGTIFRLSFTGAPQIISPPAPQTVFVGAKVVFSVAVSGAPQLFYQWKLNGTNITDSASVSGTTARVLTLNNVTAASAGTYSVVVSNALNSATSAGALLTVNSAPPAITRQPTNQTVLPGTTVTMNVTATGNLPLVYQWRFNGSNLPGATSSALILPNVQFANAGNYNVSITNNLGSVTSVSVGLRIPAVLAVATPTNGMTLTWLPPYVLQSTTNVLGPYVDVPGAVSPLTILPTAPQRYFRLRAPTAATLLPAGAVSNGQFNMSVSGVPGYRYIVQASTNLASWSSIQTNPVPFNFTDPNSALFPRRFYRTIFIP